ncbi:MAG TPA: hypothetical protein DDX29_04030 [Clostridiales bacterium]|nr:hypothetical protein [Clostridiales bacterium]
MIKKILILFFLMAIVLLLVVYYTGGLEVIDKYLNRDTVFLSDTEEVSIDLKSSKIFLEKGFFYKLTENNLATYDYKGRLLNYKEFETFIEKVFINSETIIMTEDGLLHILNSDLDFEIDLDKKNLLNILEDTDIYVLTSDLDHSNNCIEIFDQNYVSTGVINNNNKRVLSVKKSLNSNSIIVSAFDYDGNIIISTISEYLIKDYYPLWETEFVNELVIFLEPGNDGTYLVTNRNIYKLNTEGAILWQYGGYENLKDMKFVNGELYILEGENDTNLHIISKDGKLLSKMTLQHQYYKLEFYEGFLILTGNQYISYIKDDKVNLLYNSQSTINATLLDNNTIRIFTVDGIKSMNINIK